MRILAATAVLMTSLLLSYPALAVKIPRPLATDPRIKTVMYSANEVVKFSGHYGYQSSIEFAPGETIQTISVGDSLAWQLNPSGSRLFLKPIEPDATTNMTLITDKHTYLIELHGDEVKDINDPRLTFVLRFIYPEEQMSMIATSGADEIPLPDLNDRAKYNFSYTLTGSDLVSPIRIFDDGQFTYFQFRNRNADVPAFFLVDGQGNEAVINYRTRGDYIVVERVAARFTLRHGHDIVCVYNEAMTSRVSTVKSAPSAQEQSVRPAALRN